MKKLLLIVVLLVGSSALLAQAEDGAALAVAFQNEVERRLELPPEAQLGYAQLLDAALKDAGIPIISSQYLLVVDRNPNVQALFVYWLDVQAAQENFHFIGATSVSTGKPGRYDHFVTPLGVFAHTLNNRDFRAEGTRNKLGIRGFGDKDLRVFDFGWVQGERGWGSGGQSPMRLLLHATDPDVLERRLGEPLSKGCIRIPATLNVFLDRYGLLDADYERALVNGKKLWMLHPERVPTPWSGRYLAIVDSGSSERPAWSPNPSETAQ